MTPSIGWRVGEFLTEHPRVLTGGTLLLVFASAYQLTRAVDLHMQAREFVGRIQRETSEALGG